MYRDAGDPCDFWLGPSAPIGTNALRHTKDLHAVMIMMGHSDLKTTMQYLHYLPDHLRDAMRDFRGAG